MLKPEAVFAVCGLYAARSHIDDIPEVTNTRRLKYLIPTRLMPAQVSEKHVHPDFVDLRKVHKKQRIQRRFDGYISLQCEDF